MTEFATTVALAAGTAIAAFFSPCAYALLPGYVSYYVAATEHERAPLGGAVARGIAAAAGVMVTFALLSAIAVAIGSSLEPVLPVLEVLVGVTLIGLGGLVLHGNHGHFSVPLPKRRTSITGFGLFGTLYAAAAAGCIAPLFIGLVLQSLTLSVAGTVITFGVFAGSFGLLLVVTTVLTALGRGIGAERATRISTYGTTITGLILVGAGFAQIVIALQV